MKLLLFWSIILLSSIIVQAQTDYEKTVGAGILSYNKGDYTKALSLFNEVVNGGKDSTGKIKTWIERAEKCNALKEEAMFIRKNGQVLESVEVCKTLLLINPSDAWCRAQTEKKIGQFELVFVQGGSFIMGDQSWADSQPLHKVILDDFYIGKFEVTQYQWEAVMGSNPSTFKDENRPVENISWNNIQVFLEKLNKLSGQNFRLPTEAEWEFAARGGNATKNFIFSGGNIVEDVAWFTKNSYNKGKSHPDYGTHPVGSKLPNELGIFDMSGNVWEWVSDWYDARYYHISPERNPENTKKSHYRCLRGGSWYLVASYLRPGNRGRNDADYRFNDQGFRICLSAK